MNEMINVICSTNIDAYRGINWPALPCVPHKGEMIYVDKSSDDRCNNLRIPNRLEVVSVHYHTGYVHIDLWFNETDHKLYNGPYILEHGHNKDKVNYYK